MSQKRPLASRQLHALCTLGKHRSYTLAAAEMGVTQSAVTHAIQGLEKDLGVKLVHLVGNRVQFNAVGLAIVDRARRILLEMDGIRAHASLTGQNPRRRGRKGRQIARAAG